MLSSSKLFISSFGAAVFLLIDVADYCYFLQLAALRLADRFFDFDLFDVVKSMGDEPMIEPRSILSGY